VPIDPSVTAATGVTAATVGAVAGPDRPRSLSPFGADYRAVTLGMVALLGLSAFESLAVATAMPTVAAALDGMALYATAFAGPLASGIIGMTVAGSWTDRRGPSTPLLTGVGLFVAGLLVAGLAPTMLVLVAGRIVQGIGSGMLIVALYVVVARVFPEDVRPRVFAAFAAAWVVPGIVGPGIAGLVVEHVGWRWVFLGVPMLAVPALLALRPALAGMATGGGPVQASARSGARRRSRAPTARWATSGSALSVLAAAGVLALHHGGQQHGVALVGWVVIGIVTLAVSLPSLFPAGTLRSRRGLPAAVGLRGLLGAAYFGTEVFVPLLLTTHRGLRPAMAGTFLTATALAWAGGSALRGRTITWSDSALLRVGAASVTVGIVTAGLMVWPPFPLAAAFVGWCFAGFGMGVSIPTLSLVVLRLSAPDEQGANSSALQVVDAVTSAAMLALGGALFTALGGPGRSEAFVTCFAVAASVGLLALALASRTTPSRPHTGTRQSGRRGLTWNPSGH
jgi:MFS family permease